MGGGSRLHSELCLLLASMPYGFNLHLPDDECTWTSYRCLTIASFFHLSASLSPTPTSRTRGKTTEKDTRVSRDLDFARLSLSPLLLLLVSWFNLPPSLVLLTLPDMDLSFSLPSLEPVRILFPLCPGAVDHLPSFN